LQKRTLPNPPEQSLGSLKTIERMLGTLISSEHAAKICTALFGIYDLRKADAHIPSDNLDDDYRRANVDRQKPTIWQGHDMLIAFVVTLKHIARIIEHSTQAV
jgi:hypothetical protein